MNDAAELQLETVQVTIAGGCAEVVLNRPDKLNAMNAVMVRELLAAIDHATSAGARALVVRGTGRGFSAGRDLSDADPANEDGEAILRDTFNPLIARVAGLDIPTFAAVHGACLGTGMGLAMACDVVYAADDARLGSPFANIGAVLDSGAHAAFVERVGPHRALELVYTGRMLSGREAEAWGLVNRSMAGSDLVHRTLEIAGRVAAGPTLAFAESKRLVRRLRSGAVPLSEVLAAEAQAQGRASRTHDYQEGIGAFIAKRTPTFMGS
jgi:2-(1,2-epoxy-1,2-dihydrophenyl)acetyl-CoA isomerase